MTMKKILGIAVAFAILASNLGITAFASTADKAVLFSDASAVTMDVAAQTVSGRTLVPIRFLAENLGCTVVWNGDTEPQTATVSNSDTTIVMQKSKTASVYSCTVTVNGVSKTLDVPAQLIGGRTMVPVRFLSENLGYTVSYDGYTKGANVVDSKNHKIITLSLGSSQAVLYSGTTTDEELQKSQEYIDAKNVVVDNLNYEINKLNLNGYNPLGINSADVEQYKKTGIDDGLNSFQVLNYVAEDGNQLPGIILVTNGEYGMSQYVEQMKQSIDWLNSVDPTLVKSLLTTKYISKDIAPGNFWATHNWASTFSSGVGSVEINESGSVLKGFTEARKYINLSFLFISESKAIQIYQQNPSIKALDSGVSKSQFVIDWANNQKNQGKITADEWEILTKLANATISYYRKNYS